VEPAATRWNEHNRQRARTWRIGLALGSAALIALFFLFHQPTQRLEIGGHAYQVVAYQAQTSYQLILPGHPEARRYLWLRYYTERRDAADKQAEAEQIAPELYPIAERYGLSEIVLQPSRALLTPTFPLVTRSWNFAYRRDSSGQWHAEVPVRSGV